MAVVAAGVIEPLSPQESEHTSLLCGRPFHTTCINQYAESLVVNVSEVPCPSCNIRGCDLQLQEKSLVAAEVGADHGSAMSSGLTREDTVPLIDITNFSGTVNSVAIAKASQAPHTTRSNILEFFAGRPGSSAGIADSAEDLMPPPAPKRRRTAKTPAATVGRPGLGTLRYGGPWGSLLGRGPNLMFLFARTSSLFARSNPRRRPPRLRR